MIFTCKKCGEKEDINPASELGKLSALKRDTSPEAMRALSAKRGKKNNKV